MSNLPHYKEEAREKWIAFIESYQDLEGDVAPEDISRIIDCFPTELLSIVESTYKRGREDAVEYMRFHYVPNDDNDFREVLEEAALKDI